MSVTYEITDHPQVFRTIVAGSILIIGIIVSAGAFYNYFYSCCPGLTKDIVAAGIGTVVVVAGLWWLLSPSPHARTLLQASSNGLALREDDGGIMQVAWSRVGEISLEPFDERWCLKIQIEISEQERRRLRNKNGGFARRPDGYVDYMVPVLTRAKGFIALSSVDKVRHASEGIV